MNMTHPGMVSLIILYDIPLFTELQPGILYTTPLSRNGLPSNIENAAFYESNLRLHEQRTLSVHLSLKSDSIPWQNLSGYFSRSHCVIFVQSLQNKSYSSSA